MKEYKEFKLKNGEIKTVDIHMYNNIKKDYTQKNMKKNFLFKKYNDSYNIDKFLFSAILNDIYKQHNNKNPTKYISNNCM
ncbi:MAG: hypothetical protein ACI37V_02095 [Methanobrevibacter sp.]